MVHQVSGIRVVRSYEEFDYIRARGTDNVAVNCLMSVKALQAQAMATSSRTLVRKVA